MKKGKILKVKEGYNPNSSSIGTLIPHFFHIVAITGVLAIVIANLFRKADKKIKKNYKQD